MFRIDHQAWNLHYRKKLAIYTRPDPKEQDEASGKSIGWIKEGLLERYARRTVETYLIQRVKGSSLRVELLSDNPHIPSGNFTSFSEHTKPPKKTLVIKFRSSRFFLELLRAPSPIHALALCETESIMRVSDRDIFLDIFAAEVQQPGCVSPSVAQIIRMAGIPRSCISSSTPLEHPVDRVCQTTL